MAGNLGHLAATVGLDINPFLTNERVLKSMIRSTANALRAQDMAFKSSGNNAASAAQKYKLMEAQMKNLNALAKQQRATFNSLKDQLSSGAGDTDKLATRTANASNQLNKTVAQAERLKAQMATLRGEIALQESSWTGVSQRLTNFSNGVSKTGSSLLSFGTNATFFTAPIVAGLAKATQELVKFQDTMVKTKNLLVTSGESVASATAGVNEMQKQGEALSNKYGISQNQIAKGYQELVKRGYSSKQALGAMTSEVQASVASGDDYNDVLKVTSQTMEGFGLTVDKSGKAIQNVNLMTKNTKDTTNALAYTADTTATDFNSIGIAMSYVSSTAHQAGFGLNETAAALGVLSNNGLEAEKAGTGLRKVINSLTSPTGTAVKALASINLKTSDFLDKKGNLKSMARIFGMLNSHMKGLSDPQKADIFHSIFGTTGQQAAMMLAKDSSRLRELSGEIKKAQSSDYVNNLAGKNMQTAQNQIRIFQANMMNLGMTLAKNVLPVITPMVQKATELAQKFGDLDPSVQGAIAKFVLLGLSMGPLALAIGGPLKAIGGLTKGLATAAGGIGRASAAAKLGGGAFDILKSAFSSTAYKSLAMKSSVAVGESAISGLGTSAVAAGGSLLPMIGIIGGVTAAVAIGAVAYETWGKNLIESAQRTQRWGTDIGASADDAATKFKNWSTTASVALSDTASSAKSNGKEIEKAFAGMAKSAEDAAKKQKDSADKFADSIGGAAGNAIREEAAKEDAENQKHINKIQGYYQQVQAITKQARDNNIALTQDQRNQIANLQTKMAQEQVQTLGLTSRQQRLVLQAELNQTNSMTKNQLKSMVKATSDAMYKEVDNYNTAYGKIKRSTELSTREKNKALEALENEHINTLNQLGIGFINAEKARGYTRKAILEDMVDGTGMTMKEAERAYDAFKNAQKKTEATVIKLSSDMKKKVYDAAEAWNDLVLDPKTGNLKTNAQEEVNKAVNAKDKWNQIKLLHKEGKLSTNAEQMVVAALIANGKWDKMSWKEQKAWLKDGFSETIVKALEDSGQWNNLTLEQKEAIVKADGKGELANLLLEMGQWNSLTLKQQELLIKNNATKPIYEALQSSGDWNNLTLKQQEAIIDAKGKEDLVDALVKGGVWNSLTLSQKEALITTKGTKDVIDALVDMKQWNELTPKQQQAIVTAKGSIELGEILTKYKLWEGMPYSVLKEIVAQDRASGNIQAGNSALSAWRAANPGGAKQLNAQDHASGPAQIAKQNVSAFAGTSAGSSKKLKATDNASKAANIAIAAINAWNAASPVVHAFTTIVKTVTGKRRANGTVDHPGGLMTVNDQKGPLYRELIQFPTGETFIPEGRNVVIDAPMHTRVYRASDTRRILQSGIIPHFAEGTSNARKAIDTFDSLSRNYYPNPNNNNDNVNIDLANLEEGLGNLAEILLKILNKSSNIVMDSERVGKLVANTVDDRQTHNINLEQRGVYSGR